jgi:RNA polymerase sigma factor (sigma-70 family)
LHYYLAWIKQSEMVFASRLQEENHQNDAVVVSKCLLGDEGALLTLKEQHYNRLVSIAIGRGASVTEAGDVVADVWSELISPTGGKRPLLEKYHGKCSLSAWLITVVTHRFIDRRRRGQLFAELPADVSDDLRNGEPLSVAATAPPKDDLLQILRQAVLEAFQASLPEDLVMLKLVYIHGISQRQIGRLWDWHESKVSRHIDRALQDIQRRILAKVKRTDGFLDVGWEDFLDLCQTTVDLFGR